MCQRKTTCAGDLPVPSAMPSTTWSPSTVPCAIGDHASVAMPCFWPYARTSSLVKYGCTSIWFTAGTVSVSSANRSRWAVWKFDTPMLRARPSRLELLERLPGRDEVTVVERRQRPVNQEQVDIVEAERLERAVESATGVVGPVKAVVELARDEHVAAVDTGAADALPDTCLVLVHLRGVDVAVADIQRRPDGIGGFAGVDLEYAEAQLRDFRAVVQFDHRYVAHG